MASNYCTESEVDDLWGVGNVTTWSDLTNADSRDTARIARAIAWASDYIDDVFRTAQWNIPLANAASTTPNTIVQMCAQLAGWWLYNPRGTADFDPRTGNPGHRLSWAKVDADARLEEYRVGDIRKLDIV